MSCSTGHELVPLTAMRQTAPTSKRKEKLQYQIMVLSGDAATRFCMDIHTLQVIPVDGADLGIVFAIVALLSRNLVVALGHVESSLGRQLVLHHADKVLDCTTTREG